MQKEEAYDTTMLGSMEVLPPDPTITWLCSTILLAPVVALNLTDEDFAALCVIACDLSGASGESLVVDLRRLAQRISVATSQKNGQVNLSQNYADATPNSAG